MSATARSQVSLRMTQTAPITGPYATFSSPPPFRSKTKLIQMHSARTPRSSIPSVIKEDVESYYDQETLTEKYLELLNKKAKLQCQLKPMRHQYQILQESVLSNHRVLRNPMGVPIEDTRLNISVLTGDFSASILQLNQESSLLREQYMQTKSFVSQSSLQMLKNQVDETFQDVQMLQVSADELEEELSEIETKKNDFKHSTVFVDVQTQNEKIVNLSTRLQEQKQLHEQLKSDHFVLTGGNDDMDYQDNSRIIMRLSHKLDQVRRKYVDYCETLIRLREQQLREIQELSKALSEHAEHGAPSSLNIPNLPINETPSPKT